MTTSFERYDLRTTDAEAARRFYAAVLGHERAIIWPLHEQALARGARPHWLGRIGVDDVEAGAARFVDRGAARLGPAVRGGAAGEFVVLRDPGGALVAVGSREAAGAGVGVAWHVLNTTDAGGAMEAYRALFGWAPTERVDLGQVGAFQQFAWQEGGRSVGAIGDLAGRPGVHPHWTFFFEVASLDAAMAAARAAGGLVLDPVALPGGERACVCDDPQGAAFGLLERAPHAVRLLPGVDGSWLNRLADELEDEAVVDRMTRPARRR